MNFRSKSLEWDNGNRFADLYYDGERLKSLYYKWLTSHTCCEMRHSIRKSISLNNSTFNLSCCEKSVFINKLYGTYCIINFIVFNMTKIKKLYINNIQLSYLYQFYDNETITKYVNGLYIYTSNGNIMKIDYIDCFDLINTECHSRLDLLFLKYSFFGIKQFNNYAISMIKNNKTLLSYKSYEKKVKQFNKLKKEIREIGYNDF